MKRKLLSDRENQWDEVSKLSAKDLDEYIRYKNENGTFSDEKFAQIHVDMYSYDIIKNKYWDSNDLKWKPI